MQKFILSPMRLALNQAKLAFKENEVPVGAVITMNNKIIAIAKNEIRQRQNSLAHAEMLVLQQAINILQTEKLIDCNLYVTLEPCAMCAAAIAHARIKRLYYGAREQKTGAVESNINFFHQPSCNHKIEIYPGLGEQESSLLLKQFFKIKRGNSL